MRYSQPARSPARTGGVLERGGTGGTHATVREG